MLVCYFCYIRILFSKKLLLSGKLYISSFFKRFITSFEMTINVLCFGMESVGGESANRLHPLQKECKNLSLKSVNIASLHRAEYFAPDITVFMLQRC